MADPYSDSTRPASHAGMGTGGKVAVVLAVVLLVLAVRWYKTRSTDKLAAPPGNNSGSLQESQPAEGMASTPGERLPRLVDLGATQCEACKKLAPILEELKREYAGRLDVQFIDVWENPKAGKEYGIRAIPTQIFYDASGKEWFRHEGFISKEDILGKFRELGVELGSGPRASIVRQVPAETDA